MNEQITPTHMRFSPNTTRWLAWAAWIFNLSLLSTAITLFALTGTSLFQVLNNTSIVIAFASFSTVGLLITLQRPDNTVGWLFLAVGIGTGTTAFSGGYSVHPRLPGAFAIMVLGDVVWPMNFGLLLIFLPLLFPNGRLLSRRWRVVVWLTCILLFFDALTQVLSDLHLEILRPWLTMQDVNQDGLLPVFGLTIAALVSVVLRFLRSRGRERQQMKWLTYGCVVMVVLAVGGIFLNDKTEFSFAAAIICLPISIGISVLRTQLYDIDRLISRTLIYVLLSALLVLTYLALVFGLQFVLQGITRNSPVPIVISTLVVATLFQPLRRTVQNIIDRNFYRRKYNAEQVLTSFGTTLHNELDLTQLSERLVTVVQETMQPEHISLWLLTPGQRKQGEAI